MKNIYDLTFKQFIEEAQPAKTFTGELFPINASATWIKWQEAVREAERQRLAPQHVLDYFTQTLHLLHPPTLASPDILQTGRLKRSFIPQAPSIPPFTWSPSKLNCFEICGAKYGAEYVYKTVPYEESPQIVWGNRLHKAAELGMKGQACTDAEAVAIMDPYVQLLSRIEGTRFVEYKIAVDANWREASWFKAVGRMVLDFGVKNNTSFRGFDYKTGKMKVDLTQMQIYAVAISYLFSDVQDFAMRYIWIKERKTTGFQVSRAELAPIETDIRERLARMQDAHENEVFNARKNGLCRQWCRNVDCPHCGATR